ncbi:Similar to hypothetical protein LEMA_P054130.1 [Leptosphaeria maculans JN3]; acc. no. CBX92707 [Pyronema omphalodes CBS 100304]|uniref:Dolichyl-diphosphooligosaccharide--protein glycosyltransferase subunit 4 n=1 Tax=Pyronema omphalodes (strain CBS 100304) TaxID=1076935 RepID=U4L6Z5_PYROM|nr:Similar to hypothetical protein LEMA_P054130.1 [Leptosphaeria maculans JN3]; acc. no. CBX92707 [Pyronema omphalodes CBS 100304]
MVTDKELNFIACFLGSLMMFLIIVYHFLAVNGSDRVASSAAGERARQAVYDNIYGTTMTKRR